MAGCHLPAGAAVKPLLHIFSDSRDEAAKQKFTSGATETLLIFPLVLNFAESIVEKELKVLEKELASLKACGRLLYIMLMVKTQ